MALQNQEQPTLNVKLVYFTKQNSPDEPVQVAFAVTDEQGKEEIITGEVPYTYDLFHLFPGKRLAEHSPRSCLDSRDTHPASSHVSVITHTDAQCSGAPVNPGSHSLLIKAAGGQNIRQTGGKDET